MKILITNAYAKGSGGDMAILGSLISEMRRVFPDSQITVATIDKPSSLEQIFPQVHCVSSLITTVWDERDSKISKLFSLTKNGLSTILWAAIYRCAGKRPDLIVQRSEREAMNSLADADLVVGVGGGYIREVPGMIKIIDLSLTLRMLYLSHLMGKKTVLYSQSIGPFGNELQEKFAGTLLKRMQLIITRESISRKVLKKMGVKDELIFESVDAAFLTRTQNMIPRPLPDEVVQIERNYAGPLIGVTARDWLDRRAQCGFEKELAEALDWIAEKYEAKIVFVPQTTVERHTDDDRVVQKRIFDNMQQKNRAVFLGGAYDYQTLLSIYGSLDFIIGTRFHSAIFALTAKVPALVIAYEHKAEGIMADLGLSDWVVDIAKVKSSMLEEKFVKLYEEKDSYLDRLKETLPEYLVRAASAADKIKEVYLSGKSSD